MAEGDAAAVAAAAAAAAAAKPWFDGVAGVDAEMIGTWQNRGWDKKSAAEVALEATRAWKGAEKLVGVPSDQVMRVPKDVNDEAGWAAVWARLGKPADAKQYDFTGVLRADGKPVDETLTGAMRDAAFRLNLPKDTAAAVTREFAKYLDASEAKVATEKAAALAEAKLRLSQNWGKNEAAFKFVAQQSATALGVDPAAVAALEQVIGYDKTMDMFLKIGQKIGEDKFITGDSTRPQGGALTVEQAVAKRSELMSDPVWVKAYTSGDKAKLREMMGLNTIILGVAAP